MRMHNLSWLEPKEIDFDPIDVADNRELILQNTIQIIDRFFKFYNPKIFFKDEPFFSLAPMWVKKCDQCCRDLQAKLEYIVELKFQKNFRKIMKEIEKKVKALNDLIDREADGQTIKESAWAVIDQLTASLWNLKEELREKL